MFSFGLTRGQRRWEGYPRRAFGIPGNRIGDNGNLAGTPR